VGTKTHVILTRLRLADMWPTQIALPWKLHTGPLEWEWDVWTFNNSYLERLPEEAVARYMTNSRKTYKDSIVRLGHGITMTAEHLQTPQGQEEWVYKVEQLKNCVLVGLAHSVMCKLIMADSWEEDQEPYELPPMRNNGLAQAFENELLSWAMINKDEAGIKIMEQKMVARFEQQAPMQFGDLLICPRGTAMQQKNAQMYNKDFSQTGWKQGTGPDFLGSAVDGRLYHESINFPIGNWMADNDPFYSERVIGTFNTFNDESTCDIPISEYRTSYRDNYLYDEDVDDFQKIVFSDLIGKMGLWHHYGSEDNHPFLSQFGKALFGEVKTYHDAFTRMGTKYYDRVLDAIIGNERAQDKMKELAAQPWSPDYRTSTQMEILNDTFMQRDVLGLLYPSSLPMSVGVGAP
jgi:hypothetical protein